MKFLTGRYLAILILCLTIFSGTPLARADEVEKAESLRIEIISPNDGEIFYASTLGYIVSLPVTGLIKGSDVSPELVDVQLTILSDHGSGEPLVTQPDKHGLFAFYLDLNPENEPLPSVGERFFYYSEQCGDCHFATGNALPLGPLRLNFTATTADGQVATAEKRIVVDRSQYTTIPVEVLLSEGAEASLEGIPIYAETRLYEWRGRRFMEMTAESGLADLRVEALSQRDTHYLVSVPPTMIDNMRYQSVETLEVVISPNSELTDPITIIVNVESGAILGSVAAAKNLADSEAMAIALPGGNVYREKIRVDDTFSFGDLPLGEYLVAINPASGSEKGASTPPVVVNLVESATAEITLSLKEESGTGVVGSIVDERGRPIPFGWLAVSGGSQSAQVSPLDGRFLLNGLDDEEVTVNVTAPGFWSQSIQLLPGATLSSEAGSQIQLIPRNDLQEIDWGAGQIRVPPESVVIENDDTLSLVRGWLWGHNDQPEPFAINLEGALLEMDAADFALEYVSGEASWIFVKEGLVTFTSREGSVTEIPAGRMMAFGDGVPTPYPVAADEVVVDLLRDGRKPAVPLLYEQEPSTIERFKDVLASVVLHLSQGLVAVTYLVMFLMIIGTFLYGARRLIQARK